MWGWSGACNGLINLTVAIIMTVNEKQWPNQKVIKHHKKKFDGFIEKNKRQSLETWYLML